MEHLPFKKEAIDSFFSFCAVYCLLPESQNKLFKELYLMLRKNGNILLVEPNKLNPFKEREPKHPLRKSKVERWLREIGFKNINIRYCDFISRPIVKRGGVIFDFFKLSEKFFEFLQIPFSGTLVIYAEK